MMRTALLTGAATAIALIVAAGSHGMPNAHAADLPAFTPAPPPEPVSPWYVSLFGGWNAVDSINGTRTPSTLDDPRKLKFDDGFIVGGAAGMRVWDWVRIEGELSYRSNDTDTLTVENEGTFSRDGDIEAFAAMANIWGDFAITDRLAVHAGGGVGAARLWLDLDNAAGTAGDVPVKDSDTVFAFQLGAGAAWFFTPNVALTVDYRYFQAVDPKFDGEQGGLEVVFDRDDYESHSVLAGVRVMFGGL